MLSSDLQAPFEEVQALQQAAMGQAAQGVLMSSPAAVLLRAAFPSQVPRPSC